jgi:two-component system chemotaxis response regulator CheB
VDERIVVVGGSAGSLGALIEVLAGAPQLAAPVLIAVHMAAGARTSLPSILRRATGHDVRLAAHLELLEPGTVLVCPPDRHMRAGRRRVHLSTGPRENHVRPAVDPLFRSAARSHGAGAIAVVLSGMLDDGAAGMLAVRQAGGYGIVQDPRDALYGGMPSAALEIAGADAVLRASEIGPALEQLVRRPLGGRGLRVHQDDEPLHGGSAGEGHDRNRAADRPPETVGRVEHHRLVR